MPLRGAETWAVYQAPLKKPPVNPGGDGEHTNAARALGRDGEGHLGLRPSLVPGPLEGFGRLPRGLVPPGCGEAEVPPATLGVSLPVRWPEVISEVLGQPPGLGA